MASSPSVTRTTRGKFTMNPKPHLQYQNRDKHIINENHIIIINGNIQDTRRPCEN
nr:14359_t:CDS:2 [Entrophospora candida]